MTNRRFRSLGCAIALLCVGLGPASAGAQVPAAEPSPPPVAPTAVRAVAGAPATKKKIEWDPRWRKVETADYVVTGLMAAGALGTLAIPISKTRWNAMGAFDASAREELRLPSTTGRARARDASDVLLAVGLNQLVIDALVGAWWAHDRRGVAWQLLIIDAQTLSFSVFLQGLATSIGSRERPYRNSCIGDPDLQNFDCRDSKRYRSFYSGHTATAFTTAGLMCQHHFHLPLYGGGAPDVAACVAALGVAGTVGYLRVASDQHFLSDVLTGAGLGALAGFGLPWLLHYLPRSATPPLSYGLPGNGFVAVAPTPLGGTVIGAF